MATSYCYAPVAPNTPVLYKPHPRSKPIPATVIHSSECGRYIIIEVDCYWKFREVRVARHMIETYDPNDPALRPEEMAQEMESETSKLAPVNAS